MFFFKDILCFTVCNFVILMSLRLVFMLPCDVLRPRYKIVFVRITQQQPASNKLSRVTSLCQYRKQVRIGFQTHTHTVSIHTSCDLMSQLSLSSLLDHEQLFDRRTEKRRVERRGEERRRWRRSEQSVLREFR